MTTMPDTPELPPTDLPPLPRPHGYVGASAHYCRQQNADPIPSDTIARFTADQMREYLRADRATRLAEAPKGWKWVPEVPTHAMFDAFYDAPVMVEGDESDWRKSYRAMLAAAPDAAPAASSPEAADERAALTDKLESDREAVASAEFAISRDPANTLALIRRLQSERDELRAALASAPAGAGEGEQHAPVSPELDATMLWLGETRDSLRAMADRANQLLTAHCRAALAGEPAVAADERVCETEDDCTQMPWCRIRGKCQRAASQDKQQGKQGGSQ